MADSRAGLEAPSQVGPLGVHRQGWAESQRRDGATAADLWATEPGSDEVVTLGFCELRSAAGVPGLLLSGGYVTGAEMVCWGQV